MPPELAWVQGDRGLGLSTKLGARSLGHRCARTASGGLVGRFGHQARHLRRGALAHIQNTRILLPATPSFFYSLGEHGLPKLGAFLWAPLDTTGKLTPKADWALKARAFQHLLELHRSLLGDLILVLEIARAQGSKRD